jgi:hypothetical protein
MYRYHMNLAILNSKEDIWIKRTRKRKYAGQKI